jgi:hypothetical protein
MAQTEAQQVLKMLADKRRADQVKQLDAQAKQARHAAGCDDCKPGGRR